MKQSSYVFALLTLLLMPGCVTRAIQEKQALFCTNLADLNRSIAGLRQFQTSSRSTVDALKQAEEQVGEAFRKVKASVWDTQAVKLDDLEKAYDDLDKTVKDIPDRSTISQAIAAISDKVTAIESSSSQLKSGLQCP
jgi:ABC-type transporter Mla subunit MlaD